MAGLSPATDRESTGPQPWGPVFYNHPTIRGLLIQILVIMALAWLLLPAFLKATAYFSTGSIGSSFDFLKLTSGFAISMTVLPYSEASSYGDALLNGLINTLLIAGIGVVFATILGVIVGVARLSRNWVIAKIAYWYVEVIRNLPLLFQILFWYLAVLGLMPQPRQSISIFGEIFINNRGITIPRPEALPSSGWFFAAVLFAFVGGFLLRRWSRKRQEATGQQFPVGLSFLAVLILLPSLAVLIFGEPIKLEHPVLGTFRLQGGLTLIPEFIALLVAMVTYTAGFIAEIVRAGILAVSHGQTEAGRALGMREGKITRLIVIPQALRVIVPPLTSQYLNLTKNSSLAVGIGYPDLVGVGGTVLNQTGQSFQIIGLWMFCYLSISLLTSVFMNWYNKRIALVER